jgi:hypothetical protein
MVVACLLASFVAYRAGYSARIARWYAMRACLNYHVDPSTIVFDFKRARESVRYKEALSRATMVKPTSWQRLERYYRGASKDQSLVFMHGRKFEGRAFLVVMLLNRGVLWGDEEGVWLEAIIIPTDAADSQKPQRFRVEDSPQSLAPDFGVRQMRIYAGQPDATDDAAITIRYENNGQPRVYSGHLIPNRSRKNAPPELSAFPSLAAQ